MSCSTVCDEIRFTSLGEAFSAAIFADSCEHGADDGLAYVYFVVGEDWRELADLL